MCFVLCLVLYNIFYMNMRLSLVIVKKTIDIVFLLFCASDERASTQQKCLHSTSAIAQFGRRRPGGWRMGPRPRRPPPRASPRSVALPARLWHCF